MSEKSDFCTVHPNLFARTHCIVCQNGMCITCNEGSHEKCPTCRKPKTRSKKNTSNTSDLKIVKRGAIIGSIGIGLMVLGYFISPSIDIKTLTFGILFLFAFGSSATYLHFWSIKHPFFQKLRDFPFFGRKIYLLYLIFVGSYFSFILFPLYFKKVYNTFLK